MPERESLKEWGEWFAAQLVERELTQEDAARELDVTLSTISRWARGIGTPSFAELVKIRRTWGALPPILTENGG